MNYQQKICPGPLIKYMQVWMQQHFRLIRSAGVQTLLTIREVQVLQDDADILPPLREV